MEGVQKSLDFFARETYKEALRYRFDSTRFVLQVQGRRGRGRGRGGEVDISLLLNQDSCHDEPPARITLSHLTSSTYSLNHCTISFPIW